VDGRILRESGQAWFAAAPNLASNGFVTSPPRRTCLGFYDLPVRAQAVLAVHTPADAAVGARNRGVRLRFNEHPLGM